MDIGVLPCFGFLSWKLIIISLVKFPPTHTYVNMNVVAVFLAIYGRPLILYSCTLSLNNDY